MIAARAMLLVRARRQNRSDDVAADWSCEGYTIRMLVCVLLAFAFGSEDLATKAQQAKDAMAAGNFERAVALYRNLSRTLAEDTGIQLNLGLALHASGHYAQAVAQFESVLRRSPGNRGALLLSGVDWLKLEQPAKAVPLLQRVLSEDPGNSIALLELGRALQALGRLEAANEHFQRLSRLEPDNPKAWSSVGISYWALARQEFDWIEAHAPMSAQWYALLARSELEARKYKAAFHLYRQALARSPKVPGVHAGLAEVYRQTDHADWASVEDARERGIAPDQTADEVTVHYLRALAHQRSAGATLDQLSRLPANPEYHALLGHAYRIQHRDRESAEEFRRALELDPHNTAFERQVATSLWLSRDFEEAIPILTRLLRQNPSSAELNHVMGDCLVEEHRPMEAIPLLESVVTKNPDFLSAQATLGRAYAHAGQYEKAVDHLYKALPLNDRTVLFQLSQAYKRLGRQQEAAKYLAEFKRQSEATRETQKSVTDIQITGP